jgi:hypothetical protein
MQLDAIMSVLNTVKTIPQTKLAQKVLNAIQFSNIDIKNTFFKSAPSEDFLSYNFNASQAPLNEIAVKYLTFVISLSTARAFETTVCNISYEIIKDWFVSNGATLGLWMMIDYILNDKNLAQILTDQEASLSVLVNNGKNPCFVNGFLVECDTGGSNLPAKLFLNLINVLEPDGNALRTVLPTWQAHEQWSILEDYNTLNWFETVEPMFAQNTDAFNKVKSSIDQAIATISGPYQYTRIEIINPPMLLPGVNSMAVNRTLNHYEYGESLLNWLNSSEGPKKYQMRNGNVPNNFE